MSQLSRRTLVTSAAALPALSVPALASAEPDPIFAAIETYRDTHATFNAIPEDEGEDYEEAYWQMYDAHRAIFVTVPTTMTGVLALIRFLEQQVEGSYDFVTLGMDEEDNHDYGAQALFASLRVSLEQLSREA